MIFNAQLSMAIVNYHHMQVNSIKCELCEDDHPLTEQDCQSQGRGRPLFLTRFSSDFMPSFCTFIFQVDAADLKEELKGEEEFDLSEDLESSLQLFNGLLHSKVVITIKGWSDHNYW